MITWNTDVNAPCCPGEIVNSDGRTVLVQTDWDYPGVAGTFGFDLRTVQRCPACGKDADLAGAGKSLYRYCQECGNTSALCEHDSTDGSVDCACGATTMDFISAAQSWLIDNNGATAQDPGYFE